MELNSSKTRSQALLTCGDAAGLQEKLLLKPKPGGSLQTERVPRSSVLERLQTFLPQISEANERLKRQMEEAPAHCFDIENVEAAQRVIEMDVALVELSGSDSDSEGKEETSDVGEESDSGEGGEITEDNLKLPGDEDKKKKKKKANIQVVDQQEA
ncbi:NOP protein chaperone 1 [Brachionichthys hirsutus]|uniref:NOP protein chaperone 1 n=1 Tax=Brachionichthys hirsutus TaxID=412623 RepID=UPI00360526D2